MFGFVIALQRSFIIIIIIIIIFQSLEMSLIFTRRER